MSEVMFIYLKSVIFHMVFRENINFKSIKSRIISLYVNVLKIEYAAIMDKGILLTLHDFEKNPRIIFDYRKYRKVYPLFFHSEYSLISLRNEFLQLEKEIGDTPGLLGNFDNSTKEMLFFIEDCMQPYLSIKLNKI